MCKELNNLWKPSALYTNVRENRREILTLARQNKNIYTEPSFKTPALNDESDNFILTSSESDESHYSDFSNTDLANCDTFKVILSAVEWGRIKPAKNNANRLKKGVWSHFIPNTRCHVLLFLAMRISANRAVQRTIC